MQSAIMETPSKEPVPLILPTPHLATSEQDEQLRESVSFFITEIISEAIVTYQLELNAQTIEVQHHF